METEGTTALLRNKLLTIMAQGRVKVAELIPAEQKGPCGLTLAEARDLLKLDRLFAGELVVTNDQELDRLQLEADKHDLYIRTLPHKGRVGLLDQYDAWIGGPTPPTPTK